jgi:predicted nucleic acid-binding protein
LDRLFLDANILFSAAYRRDAGLLRLWRLKDAQLVTSAYALEEARVNLQEQEQHVRLSNLMRSVKIIAEIPSHSLPKNVTLPAKDQPILLAAIEAKATHLLTGDIADFGRYYGRVLEGVLILPSSEYLRNRTAL